MEPENVQHDLQSLRRLYSLLQTNLRNEYIPQSFLLDMNSQFLLKRLLDSAAQELLTRQSNILAAAQLRLSRKVILQSKKPLNVVESQSDNGSVNGYKTLETRNRSLKRGLIQRKDSFVEEVADSIEEIETQLSALRFCSRRLDSDDTTKSCKPRSLVVSDIEEQRQNFQPPSMSAFKRHERTTPGTLIVSQNETHVNNGALVRFQRSDDQFRRVKSRPLPLPSLPVRSVDFRKPSQGNRTADKKMMKPTLLDQETEIWDEDSIGTESVTSSASEDEQLVSTELESEENSEETRLSSGSNWETQGESVTESESGSSYPSQSDNGDDDSQVSASPPRKKRDKGSIGTEKKALGRLKRFKNKLGQVFHHHHHHHHYHHHHEKGKVFKPSALKNLQRTFHRKKDESPRKKSESKGLTTYKQKHRGGKFQALVEGLMRHRRQTKKQKHKLPSHGKKLHWWKTLKKRQGGVQFSNKRRVKLGK